MSKFKVGDKVKVVRKDETGCPWNSEGLMKSTLGQTGIVLDIYLPDVTHALRYEVRVARGRSWNYNENCLELVQEETMSTLTHRELLQALLDGETLVSCDGLEMSLDTNGYVTTITRKGVVKAKYFLGFWYSEKSKYVRTWTIKPKVILINGIEVPEPCRKEIPLNTKHYIPNITSKQLYTVNTRTEWLDTAMRIDKGIVHLTKEAAIQHAKALLSFTSKEEI